MQCGCQLDCDGGRRAVIRTRFESLLCSEPHGEVVEAGIIRMERLDAARNAVLVDDSREFDHSIDRNAMAGLNDRNRGRKQHGSNDARAGVADGDASGLRQRRPRNRRGWFLPGGDDNGQKCGECEHESAAQGEFHESAGEV